MIAFPSARHEKAYRLGEDSVADREAENPYDDEELAEQWDEGRNAAEVAAGEGYADFCDPSSRDLYE